MSKFQLGDRVLNLQTNQKGVICEVRPPSRGRQLYKVMYKDNIEVCLEHHLDLIFNNDDPFELCKKNIYGNKDQFLLLNTTYKINNSNNNTISSLKASKTIFKAYQFKPLLKFLNSNSRRLLIADEVGLGKTIEAGHILLELKARNEFKAALIVCPNSLKVKWQIELKEKFGLDFKIYDSLDDTITDLQYHPNTARGILNYEKIRVVRKYDDEKKISNELIDYLEDSHKNFSIILCDEAHKMKNSGTDTFKLMSKILDFTNTAVFLTATPIMLGEEDLYNLLHLLNPLMYDNFEVFKNLVESNKPIIEALRKLNSQENLKNIKNGLLNASIYRIHTSGEYFWETEEKLDDVYKEIPLYQQVIDLLDNSDNLTLRALIQEKLSSLSFINEIFSRTRKREVSIDERQHTERRAHKIVINLNEVEKEILASVIKTYLDEKRQEAFEFKKYMLEEYDIDIDIRNNYSLGLVQKRRMIASSVNAYKLYTESNFNTEKFIELVKSDSNSDSKINELINIIRGVQKSGANKLVVFSIFKFIVRYLEIKLSKLGYNVYAIHGDIKEREKIIDGFKNNPDFSILLSTEVGSEGLDMQFCSHLVNFDLPWNPMVVEQRIGRIDRFGQKSPSIHIYNLVVSGSIQEYIYDKLLMRIGIFQGAIGDLEMILEEMGEKIKGLENDIYGTNLTISEQKKKVRDIAMAIENEKINLDKIEDGLTNTLTNDIYFQNEINKIRDRRLYVTADELLNYLKMLLNDNLTTCSLEEIEDNRYNLTVPKSDLKVVSTFLYKWQPLGEEYDDLFKRYRNRLLDDFEYNQKRELTFDQLDAFENKGIDYVNIYNPLIIAASNYYKEKVGEIGKTFQMKCKSEKELNFNPGLYYLGIYSVSTKKYSLGKDIVSYELVPIVYDVAKDMTVVDKDLNMKIFSLIQDETEYLSIDEAGDNISEEECNNMQSDFTEYISNFIDTQTKEIKAREDSLKVLRKRQTEEYYKLRIERAKQKIRDEEWKIEWLQDKKEIANAKRDLGLAQYNLRKLEDEKKEAINRIESILAPSLTSSLISISKIKVI